MVASEPQQSWSTQMIAASVNAARSAVWSRSAQTMTKENIAKHLCQDERAHLLRIGMGVRNGKEQHILAGRRNISSLSVVLRAHQAGIGLHMVWARTAPISPELSHQAAVDVQKFSSQVTGWQFKSRQLSDAGSRSQIKFASRSGPALRLSARHSTVWPATLGVMPRYQNGSGNSFVGMAWPRSTWNGAIVGELSPAAFNMVF